MKIVDLNRLSDEELWQIILKMPREDFGYAMKGTGDIIRTKFFRAMSKKMCRLILSDYAENPQKYENKEAIEKSLSKLLMIADEIVNNCSTN